MDVKHVFALPPGSHPIRHCIHQLRSFSVTKIHNTGSTLSSCRRAFSVLDPDAPSSMVARLLVRYCFANVFISLLFGLVVASCTSRQRFPFCNLC